jgi:hypothetical protein
MYRRVYYGGSYRLLARGECRDYVYDYFVAFDGVLTIQRGDYITFYNGRYWFKGYFKGYTLRICRRMNGRLERIGFISMIVYEDFKWTEMLFNVGKTYGIGVVLRRVGDRWVNVFPGS